MGSQVQHVAKCGCKGVACTRASFVAQRANRFGGGDAEGVGGNGHDCDDERGSSGGEE